MVLSLEATSVLLRRLSVDVERTIAVWKIAAWMFVATMVAASDAAEPSVDFEIQRNVVLQELSPDYCWFHPRVASAPNLGKDGNPLVLLTLQKHLQSSDHYSGLYYMTSTDLGQTWTKPVLPKELEWRRGEDGETIGVCDVTPVWHAKSKRILAIGIQLRYDEAGNQLNDNRTYVTSSNDGLHFDKIKPWTFDDGRDLGSYNTQQHWITHSDGLFLAYTRRGADNDHIIRNRAPLFVARVDVESLTVLHKTEEILIPERGVMLGNFGASAVNAHESWVTDSEYILDGKPHQRGANGSTFIARLRWSKPNRFDE